MIPKTIGIHSCTIIIIYSSIWCVCIAKYHQMEEVWETDPISSAWIEKKLITLLHWQKWRYQQRKRRGSKTTNYESKIFPKIENECEDRSSKLLLLLYPSLPLVIFRKKLSIAAPHRIPPLSTFIRTILSVVTVIPSTLAMLSRSSTLHLDYLRIKKLLIAESYPSIRCLYSSTLFGCFPSSVALII